MRSTTELRRRNLRNRAYSESPRRGEGLNGPIEPVSRPACNGRVTSKPEQPDKPDPKAEKAKRLAAALRANLRRRKAGKEKGEAD